MPIQASLTQPDGTVGTFSVVTSFSYNNETGYGSGVIGTWLDQAHYVDGSPPLAESSYDISSLITPDLIASIEQQIMAVPVIAALTPAQLAPVQTAAQIAAANQVVQPVSPANPAPAKI